MKILITNDDSHRSPLLEIAVRYFSHLGEVHLVVPLHEQSWTGKSMTRFAPIHAHKVELCGLNATSVSGTPADCINLAIHNLLTEKPDLVISGINAGFNMGLGFLLSSGTVGACIEANLAGVPAIALSQAFDSDTRNRYMSDYMIAPEMVRRFEQQSWKVLDAFFAKAFTIATQEIFLKQPITWNINFPFLLTDPSVIKLAPLGRTRYGRCFTERSAMGDVATFQHESVEEIHDPESTCDSNRILSGCATVSPIDVWALTGKRYGAEVEALCGALRL